MDTQSLAAFVRVVDLGSFTRAAEELRYAQSTVTMQVRRLEEELGFSLFERIGRKCYLTPGGQAFVPHAMEMLRIAQKAGSLGTSLKEARGTLRVGALETLLFSRVIPVLPAYRAACPQVELTLKLGQSAQLLEMLKQNQLDMVYITGAANADLSMDCGYSKKEYMVFTAAANHPLAGHSRIPLHQVLQQPFVITERSGYCCSRLHTIAQDNKHPLHSSVCVDSVAAVRAILHDGSSVGFLPEYALDGDLVRLDVDMPEQVYYSQLLYHKNKWRTPQMEAFIRCVQEK